MEEFVQGRLDAQLLGGVLIVQRTRESLVKATWRGRDRELLLVRHRHGELVFIVLRLGLEVRHHKVARMYRLPRISPAILLPFVIIAGMVKTTLARHRRWFSIHQFRLHLGTADSLRTRTASLRYVLNFTTSLSYKSMSLIVSDNCLLNNLSHII